MTRLLQPRLFSIRKSNLDIKNCLGQGYDGASNMSSEAVGVQKHIKKFSEKAVYTHCFGHNLKPSYCNSL